MSRFAGFEIRITDHFKRQLREKGFAPEAVIATVRAPREEYPSGKRYPGQWRLCGNGVCIVVKPDAGTLTLITVYADRVVTAPRADQLSTEQGRRYAERYAQGLGRG